MPYRKVTTYFFFLLCFTLVVFEILLRLAGINATWSENTGHGYISYYGKTLKSWYHVHQPNTEFDQDNRDFKYHHKVNSLGLRDREDFFSDSTPCKVICVGDSYTEGVGAPADSTYPHFLEQKLNDAGYSCQVLNAGVAGSDPFYEYVLVRDKLIQLHPDYVVVDINSTDITDFIFRGGLERFKADGSVVYNKGPWFAGLYHWSYVVRFIMNNLLDYKRGNLFVTRNDYVNL
jgi:hypothetical protein